jgi:DNA-binding NarL/FixJ family response regulator
MRTFGDSRISVLVTYPDPIIANGLVATLQACSEFEVCTSPPAPDSLVDRPNIVVTDYRDAIVRCVGAAKVEGSSISLRSKVLVVTTQEREHDVRLALEAGVHGYLMLDCELDELKEGIRVLHRGSRYLCMSVAQRMADSLTRDALTQRESEVLRFVVAGVCNKTIAAELAIAVGTVKAHVKAIMSKLDASSRTQAARIATQRGLVELATSTTDRYASVDRSAPSALAWAH